MSIATNDPDENPYVFNAVGSAISEPPPPPPAGGEIGVALGNAVAAGFGRVFYVYAEDVAYFAYVPLQGPLRQTHVQGLILHLHKGQLAVYVGLQLLVSGIGLCFQLFQNQQVTGYVGAFRHRSNISFKAFAA